MSVLLRGGTVIDADGERPADVRVDGARIAGVGRDLAPSGADETVDLRGDIVIPGLVNAHYHSPDNWSTGLLPDAPLELWGLASGPARAGSADELRLAALWGAAQLLRGGVTAAVDMIRTWPDLDGALIDAVAGAYESVGMRAAVAPVVSDLPLERTLPLAPWVPVRADAAAVAHQLGLVADIHRRWHGRDDRIAVHVAPSAPQRCTDELFAGAADLARRLGTRLHAHALETRAQAEQARRRWGVPLLGHLERIGALTAGTVLAHVAWPDAGDAERLARTGAVVVHDPASNLALGSGRAPLPQLLRAGVTIALGSDAATCNDGLSMFEAMKLATIVHRPAEPDWDAWPTARDALRLATAGGAAALGRAPDLGRVAAGQLADVVVLDARAAAFVPANDLVRQLVMRAEPSVVKHVMVGGRVVVRDGRLLTLDWDALIDEVRAVGEARRRDRAAPAAIATGAVEVAAMLRRLRRG